MIIFPIGIVGGIGVFIGMVCILLYGLFKLIFPVLVWFDSKMEEANRRHNPHLYKNGVHIRELKKYRIKTVRRKLPG